MKKSLLIGLALLSLGAISCTREMEAPVQKPVDGNVVILGATVDQTKAAIADNAFTWQAGDKLSVATSNGLVEFKLKDGAGNKAATFEGILPAGATLGEAAVYPAGAHKVTADGVTLNLPAEYVFEADNTNIPLVGPVSDKSIKFTAVGGVARIIAGIPAGASKVVLSTDKKITGDFDVSDEGVIAAGEGEDKVTVTFDPVNAATNMTFNFPLPVGEYKMSFAVLDATDKVLAELAGSAAHTIKAADVLIFDELEFPEMNVTLNGNQAFATIQDAVNAAAALTEGPATITIAEGEYDENVIINAIPVPVVIDGIDPAKVITKSFEVMKSEVTFQNITIKPRPNDVVYTPSLETVPDGYNYPYGVYVYRANYGVIFDNIILDMSASHSNTTGIFFIDNNADERGNKRDAIKNSTLGAADADYTRRNAQIYGEAIDIENNIISGGHRDYGIRVGRENVDAVIKNNQFKNSNPTHHASGRGYGIDFYAMKNSKVVLEGNTCDETFSSLYGATDNDVTLPEANNVFEPVLVYDGGKLLVQEAATIKDFAEEYVKILDIWEANVGTLDRLSVFELATDEDTDVVENAHYIPNTTTITVAGKEYTIGDMFETALRSYLLIRGYNGLEQSKYGLNSIAALDGGAVAMSETAVPETHGYYFNTPLIESSNGGYLVKLVGGEEIHCQVDPIILDNWAMRSLNFSSGKPITNFCGYPRDPITNYSGCFSSARALITYAFFFKYMLENGLDKADGLGADVIIRSELFGNEPHAPEAPKYELEKVWVKYNTDEFWTNFTGAGDWQRNIASDSKYIYMPQAGGATGMNAVAIANPTQIVKMSMEGISGGTHALSAVGVLDKDGQSVVVASNLALGGNGWGKNGVSDNLKVYAWTSIDADPTLLLEYTLEDPNFRLGDKMDVLGNWKDGYLVFKNFDNSGASGREIAFFKVTDGTVSATPVIKTISGTDKMNHMSAFYVKDDYAVVSGTQYNGVVKANGETAYDVVSNPFTGVNHGFNYFTAGGENYIAWLSFETASYLGASINVILDNEANLKESFDKMNGLTKIAIYNDSVAATGNGNADLSVSVIDGTPYIIGCAYGSSLAVYKLVNTKSGATGPDITVTPGGDF